MDKRLARRLGRYAQFAVAASQEALTQAGLDLTTEDTTRVATVIGTGSGDIPFLETQLATLFTEGPGSMHPLTVPRVSINMASGGVALAYGLTGPSFALSSACATGSHAIATAWMLLQTGLADVALAGGTEAAITASFLEGYIACGAVSKRRGDPALASQPFDQHRDGFVLSEGAAVLVLETLSHARRRTAHVLAELAGVGMACDAHHLTACHPQGRGGARAITQALSVAGVRPDELDYVNAHGTSTVNNDASETAAIHAALGTHASHVPISSIKSMIGHSIGAAGALEAVICIMALCEGIIPPTINLDTPDPACDLDYVPKTARRARLRTIMSNSFGFGGQACVLVFRKPTPVGTNTSG